LTDPARRKAQAARAFADANTARIVEADSGDFFHADVTAVAPGKAKDGVHALVQVTYRLQTTTAAGYPDFYTPAVGDRVFCAVTKYHSLEILHRSVGEP
jgi:hypothetical protein